MIHADTIQGSQTAVKELKGWHVLLIMLSFFGVMFAVNGVFLYHAVTSFPGEDIKKSYVQGLNYNETLSARASQAALGWRAEAGLDENRLVVRLYDANRDPLSSRPMIAELRRKATNGKDMAIVFQPQLGGEYVAQPGALAAGQWLLRVSVLDPDAESVIFNIEKTLFIP